jgi:D-alanine-D-alanine ligase
MKVFVVHHAVDKDSGPDERDVIVQAEAVRQALRQLGHETALAACDLNLDEMRRQIQTLAPDLVFNLVESLEGQGRLIHLFPFMLDSLGIPYTGAPAEAVYSTSHKLVAKQHMAASGLPTAPWLGPCPPFAPLAGEDLPSSDFKKAETWIIKSIWEHASLGLDGQGLLRPQSLTELYEVMRRRAGDLGGSCFAEKFIDGREFNLSLLAGPAGPEVLPPAEIVFEGYGQDQPRIVCYRAKWDETSYEYHHTPRRFGFPDHDEDLLSELKAAALRCWHLFGLRGYARVDFRVDADGRPWILEVNTNPCLSPDAGFAAALEAAGLDYTNAVDRIIADAFADPPLPTPHHASPGIAKPTANAAVVSADARGRFRYEVRPSDSADIRRLVEATGYFHPFEVAVAVELVDERLAKGADSGYDFIFLEEDNRLLGYACYGPVPCTRSSYDLYWIAVDPQCQGGGLGRRIVAEAERLIGAAGGLQIYIDTSQRPQYASTRGFYESCGYRIASVLKNYYAPGEGKVVYCKEI